MVWANAIWRSASTYIWHKFRQMEGYRCYLEPLHEELLHLNPARQEERFRAGPTALLRHPPLSKQGFDEYPVLPGGGVPGYLKRFGYERCVLEEGDEDPELVAYLSGLVAHASRHGQRPMFQPNRALLRSDWLCRRLGLLHVFIVRQPWNVWRSMLSYSHLYFPAAVLNTVCHNRETAYFSPLHAVHSLPYFDDPNCQAELARYADWARNHIDIAQSVFFYYFAVTTLYNLSRARIVIDVDAVSCDRRASEAVEQAFGEQGIAMSLADCRVPVYEWTPEEILSHRRTEADTLDLIRASLSGPLAIPKGRLAELRPVLGRDLSELCLRFVAPEQTAAEARAG
jgi:hypothetical protein